MKKIIFFSLVYSILLSQVYAQTTSDTTTRLASFKLVWQGTGTSADAPTCWSSAGVNFLSLAANKLFDDGLIIYDSLNLPFIIRTWTPNYQMATQNSVFNQIVDGQEFKYFVFDGASGGYTMHYDLDLNFIDTVFAPDTFRFDPSFNVRQPHEELTFDLNGTEVLLYAIRNYKPINTALMDTPVVLPYLNHYGITIDSSRLVAEEIILITNRNTNQVMYQWSTNDHVYITQADLDSVKNSSPITYLHMNCFSMIDVDSTVSNSGMTGFFHGKSKLVYAGFRDRQMSAFIDIFGSGDMFRIGRSDDPTSDSWFNPGFYVSGDWLFGHTHYHKASRGNVIGPDGKFYFYQFANNNDDGYPVAGEFSLNTYTREVTALFSVIDTAFTGLNQLGNINRYYTHTNKERFIWNMGRTKSDTVGWIYNSNLRTRLARIIAPGTKYDSYRMNLIADSVYNYWESTLRPNAATKNGCTLSASQSVNWFKDDTSLVANSSDLVVTEPGRYNYRLAVGDGFAVMSPSIFITDTSNACTITSTQDITSVAETKVFPNSASNLLSFSAQEPIGLITLIDEQGRPVLRRNLNTINATVNVEHLSAGIYYAIIETTDGKQSVRRVVIAR